MPNTKMAETTCDASCTLCASLHKEIDSYRKGSVIVTNELANLKPMLQQVLDWYQNREDIYTEIKDQNRRLEEINKQLTEKLQRTEEKLKMTTEYANSTRDNTIELIKTLSL